MLARLRKRKGLLMGLTAVLAIAVAAVFPWAYWHAQAARALDVVIVDKTVAKGNTREHNGLVWMLRHEKIVQRATDRPLRTDTDYAGSHLRPDGQRYVEPIPDRPSDLVYLADTYGIYQDDVGQERPLGLKSDLIDGGLSAQEVTTITRNLRRGAVLVGEFNCLASPTVGVARRQLEDALGVRWSGWIGRHFSFLDLTVDLPLWIPRSWRRQTGKRWAFRGPGYVLVDERGHLVVLQEGIDTRNEAVKIRFSDAAAHRFGTARSMTYDNWFDIVVPAPGAEVIATYEIGLTDSGRVKADGIPIDAHIPAVVRTDRPSHLAYYFAGDFADMDRVPNSYRYKWLPQIKARLAARHRDDQTAFYWSVFVPMMQRIVAEASRRASTRPA